jgi:Ca2+-transporting ATPase
MRQPPRDPRSGVITPAMWLDIAFVGLVMGAGTLLVLDGSLPGGLLPGSGTLA